MSTAEQLQYRDEIRDEDGRLLVTYESGDLILRAAHGRVRIEGRDGVEIRSGTSALRVDPEQMGVTARHLTTMAGRITTTAGVIAQRVESWELHAEKMLERASHMRQEATELLETRAGRVRSLVKGAFRLMSKRTDLVSTEETSIDGKKILLG